MDPEIEDRFRALLRKATADIIADWHWPEWRRDEGQRRADDDRPERGA